VAADAAGSHDSSIDASNDGPSLSEASDVAAGEGSTEAGLPSDASIEHETSDTGAMDTGSASLDASDTGPPEAAADGGSDATTAGWSNQDVGAVKAAGSWCAGATCSPAQPSGTYQVTGSGTDMALCSGEMTCGNGPYDEFQYVYQSISGDATIAAHVVSIANVGSDWSKALVMMRDGLASDAPAAAMGVASGATHGYLFLERTATGGMVTFSQAASGGAPVWLRVTRRGNVFAGSYSANGTTWTQLGSATVSMPATVQVGLGVVSHVNGTLATGVFDNVSITTP
jgi:hypothetical protein